MLRRLCLLVFLSGLLRSAFPAQTNFVDFHDLGLCLTIPVSFLGNEVRFVVDTGSTVTVLDKSITKHLVPRGAGTAEFGGANPSDVKFFEGIPLSIGSITSKPGIVVGIDLSDVASVYGELTYGVLGLDVLADWVLDVDFEKQSIRFLQDSDELPSEGGFISLPMREHPGKDSSIAAKLGGVPIELSIDFGNTFSIGLNPQDWKKVFPSGDVGFRSKLINFKGDATETVIGRVKRLDVSTFSYTNLLACRLVNTNVTSLLGLPFFRRHHTILNYPKKVVKLRRTDYTTEDENGMSGLSLLWSFERKLFVSEVPADSRAAGSGLKPGDEIIAIDDKNVDTLSQASVMKLFRKGNGKLLCLDIRRGDSKQRICFLLERSI
jgi:hypothetical protein